MLNKKQAHGHIERTIKWNIDRGNTPDTLNWDLEVSMLEEEVAEVKEATSEANRFKELLDNIFVTYGSLGKMNLTAQQIVDGYELVIKSNEAKSATKNVNGKITKGKNFVKPEPLLEEILLQRTK